MDKEGDMHSDGVSWKDRIVRFDRVDPNDIEPHPLNFRTHPERQRNLVTGLLNDVGWIDTVIVNENTGRLIDGHLRLEQAIQNGCEVPVIYVNLTLEEEALALTTLDKSAELAGANMDNLEVLVDQIDLPKLDVSVQEFIKDMSVDIGASDTPTEPGSGPESDNFQFTLRFDNEEQKENFYDLLRLLKDEYPDADSVGHRFQLFYHDSKAD